MRNRAHVTIHPCEETKSSEGRRAPRKPCTTHQKHKHVSTHQRCFVARTFHKTLSPSTITFSISISTLLPATCRMITFFHARFSSQSDILSPASAKEFQSHKSHAIVVLTAVQPSTAAKAPQQRIRPKPFHQSSNWPKAVIPTVS